MNFSIVYNKSGDDIQFLARSSESFELLEYYVQNLNADTANTFNFRNGADVTGLSNILIDAVDDVNTFIYPFIDSYVPDLLNIESCFDQYTLNKIHADWANNLLSEYNINDKKEKYSRDFGIVNDICNLYPDDMPIVTVSTVLSRLNLLERYSKLNEPVHELELAFNKFDYCSASEVVHVNPFSKSLATHDVCHFNILFNHLGRPLYGKFQSFDMICEHDDENTFNELHGMVSLSLKQAETIPFSKEFIAWCKRNNKTPAGRNLGIGNIVDLQDNLTEYRKLVYRNTCNADTFSIVIN